jgi:hypothetical protein
VERLATATFFRLKNVDVSFTVSSNFDTVWLNKGHAASDLLLGHTTKKDTNVVTSFSGRQQFVESFNACDNARRWLSADASKLNFVVDLALALLNSASGNDTSSSDVQRSVNRH